MKIFIVFVFLLNAVLFAFPVEKSSIYKKEIVYTYNYFIKRNGITTTGKMYLGCLGKLWSVKEQEQFAIIWTESEKELLEKIYTTGVIEDSTRIFLHPPRKDEFSILEYSPFPEINFPLKEGNSWEWNLALGKFWANDELKVLADDTLRYKYQIDRIKSQYFSPAKKTVDVYEVSAGSVNPKFDSKFSGVFNQQFGFIRMEFANIDSSVIIFEMESVDSFETIKKRIIDYGNNHSGFEPKTWK